MILNVNGVRFRYRSSEVLKSIEFSVCEHEIVSILGPNGVGKTTLLKCINTLLRPQGGCILINNENVMKMDQIEIARKVGYVAQRNEGSRITVFDAILLGRYPYIKWKVSEEDVRIVNSIIESLHLKKYVLRYIDELSGGELQKVCTARALVQEPQILLLDEPTSNLDLKNQCEIMCLIKKIVRSHGVAAIMTMHDLNMAISYSDKLLFVKDGVVFAYCSKYDITADMVSLVYDIPVVIKEFDNNPVIIPLIDH